MTKSKTNSRKWWAAGLLSYLVPGLGQIYNGQVTKGLLFYCLYSLWGSIVFISALKTMKRAFSGFHVFLLFFSLLISFAAFIFIITDAIISAKKQKKIYQLKKYNQWHIYLLAIFISLSVSLSLKITIRSIILKPYRIPTASMSPTLLPGDYIMSNKLFFCKHNPECGDMAVFTNPANEKMEWIKRIIGLPDDTLEIRNKIVFINSSPLDEPYTAFINSKNLPEDEDKMDNFGPVVIPENQYFMLGDNRDNSLDSRHFGPVERYRLTGKPTLIYLSLQKQFPFLRLNRIGKRLLEGQKNQ